MNIVVTGKCSKFSREKLEKKIALDSFWNLQQGIRFNTDILVCGDKNSSSSKMTAAKRRNKIKIMTYEEFFDKYPEFLL